MSSIIRRRRGLIAAIGFSCLRGWACTTQILSDGGPSALPAQRFSSILKINLQGNRPPTVKNRQIRLLERAQSSSPFNSFRILHGRLNKLSKRGGKLLRSYLYETANVLLTRVAKVVGAKSLGNP